MPFNILACVIIPRILADELILSLALYQTKWHYVHVTGSTAYGTSGIQLHIVLKKLNERLRGSESTSDTSIVAVLSLSIMEVSIAANIFTITG